ncbi:pyridoxamine 5'-phosphate oxidase family protein [Streptomyces sp. FH025]|uniref:pyridoxamine 5'-phosphate oxidase family protein n=1 Tax=Streptomyces sp. FH025 TaxID=2815937 RepID=UPI001A9F7709|nr:pyridoxamine 5'-phosphate oxidase family protein [Streptomyces sp. FH025]MBO1413139.1 pyridoxamine 5'-phosphate oxidase family protein [Streptomyces sp. FH025]
MTPDFAPLEERHCRRLLAKTSIGRVVYTVGALPAVLPVRYRLDGDGNVLLRTTAGSEFLRAVAGALVAFQADEVSAADGGGWSVTVLGTAEATRDRSAADATQPHARAHAQALAQDTDRVTIRIRPEWVTGHLLKAVPPLPA